MTMTKSKQASRKPRRVPLLCELLERRDNPTHGVAPTLPDQLYLLNEGGQLNVVYQFTDPDSSSFTGTVDYGQGLGSQPITVNANKTVNLANLYPQDSVLQPGGFYPLTLNITDDQGNESCVELKVKVANVVPVVNGGPDLTINVNDVGIINGSFTDPGADNWTGQYQLINPNPLIPATIGPISLNPDKTFQVSASFSVPGTYKVILAVNDGFSTGRDTVFINVVTPPVNQPPVIVGRDYTLLEGGTLFDTRSFSDPDSTSFNVYVDTGLGAGYQLVSVGPSTSFVLTELYPQDSSNQPGGFFAAKAKVVDDHGAEAVADFRVFVGNVLEPPQVGGNETITVGGSITRSVPFIDPGTDSPWSVQVYYGDGSPVVSFANADHDFDISHQYNTPGTYTVSVQVSDDDTSRTSTFVVTVNAPTLPPVIEDGQFTITEGDTLAVPYGFSDPDSASYTVYADYGFGAGFELVSSGPSTSFNLSYLYPQDSSDQPGGFFPIQLKVEDDQGHTDTALVKVFVLNDLQPPQVGGNTTISVGTSIVRLVPFVDPGDDAPWHVSVDYGDGSPLENFNNPDRDFFIVHEYTTVGSFTVEVFVSDDDTTRSASFVTTVQALPKPPVIEDGQFTITEGSTPFVLYSFTDPDSSTYTVYADYGFGAGYQVVSSGPATTFALSHFYPQDSSDQPSGSFPILLKVVDDQGLEDTALVNMFVLNRLDSPVVGGPITITVGQTVTRTGTFVDPGADSPWTVSINYQDGSPIQTFTTTTHDFPISHQFTAPGVYTVLVNVSDDDFTKQGRFVVTVNSVPTLPPVIEDGQFTITEGDTLLVPYGFSDPDSASYTVYADYGFGAGFELVSSGPSTSFNLSHLYPQDSSDQPGGFFPIQLKVEDDQGHSDTALVKVFVLNDLQPPQVGGNTTISVGSSIVRLVPFVDPGDDAPWHISVDYGDGSPLETFNNPDRDFFIVHEYTTVGSFTVEVFVSDDDTTRSASFVTTVQALPKPPVINDGQYTITEGDTLSELYSFSDPDSSTYTVYADYGFGAGYQVVSVGPATTFALTHFYPQDSSDQPSGSFPILLKVVDDQGLEDTALVNVFVLNRLDAPLVGPDVTISVGQTVTRTGTFVDPGADSPWTVSINYQDGSPIETFTTTTHDFPISHQFTAPGTYTVLVNVSDDDFTKQGRFVVTVNPPPVNNPPLIDGAVVHIVEGDTMTKTLSFSDPDSSSFTVYADYGFGAGYQLVQSGPSTSFTVSRLYPQDSSDRPGGFFPVLVKVVDDHANQVETTVQVFVSNALEAPVVGSDATINVGDGIARTVTFVDPGADSPWSITVNYGDGSPLSVFTSVDHDFVISHIYTNTGTFTVTVQVTDDDTSRSSSFTVKVESPDTPPVLNQPPAINGATYYLTEGDTLSVPHGFTDPDSTNFMVYADYGFGAGPQLVSSGPSKTFSLSQLYAQDSSDQPGGFYKIKLTVIDDHGNSAQALVRVFVANRLDTPVVGGPAVIDIGGTLNRGVSFVDPGADSPWKIVVSYGDGSTAVFTNPDHDFVLSHKYDRPGDYTVTVTVFDDDTSRTASFGVHVPAFPVYLLIPPPTLPGTLPPYGIPQPPQQFVPPQFLVPAAGFRYDTIYGSGWDNHPPEVYFDQNGGAPWQGFRVIDEGDTLIQDGHVYDPDGDPCTAMVNYGDGTGWQALPLRDGRQFTLIHRYEQEGTYEVWVKATDIYGLQGYNVLRVVVRNVAPRVEADGDRNIQTGNVANFRGSFRDPGADTWTATIDYGDGSKVENLPLTGKSFRASHRYARAGTYRVTIRVFDGTEYGTTTVDVIVTDQAVVPAPAPMPKVPGGEDDDLGCFHGCRVDDFFGQVGAEEPVIAESGLDMMSSLALAGVIGLGGLGMTLAKDRLEEEKKKVQDQSISDEFWSLFGRSKK